MTAHAGDAPAPHAACRRGVPARRRHEADRPTSAPRGSSAFSPSEIRDPKGFFIDGRLGLARTTLKASVDFVPAPPLEGANVAGKVVAPVAGLSGEYTHTQPYPGVGVGYDFNAHNGATLNYTHQNKLKPAAVASPAVELDTLALGFEYRF